MEGDFDFQERFRKVLFLVKNEATAVITEMRQNKKWASSSASRPMSLEASKGARELMHGLLNLRFGAFYPEEVVPMDFVEPFLRIIVDDKASGPITAVALMSINRLLSNNVLGLLNARVSESMHAIVAAVRHCKFEATDAAHDQMVLCKILQTLCTCLHCPTGRRLSDEDVCSVFQSAYRIGFDTQIVLELSDMVVDMVKDALFAMVRTVFGSLRSSALAGAAHSRSGAAPGADAAAAAAAPATPESTNGLGAGAAAGGGAAATNGASEAEPEAEDAVSARPAAEEADYGVVCAQNILSFLIRLISLDGMTVFALELIRELLHALGSEARQYPTLMQLIQVDLLTAMFAVFKENKVPEGQRPAGPPLNPPSITPPVVTQMTQVMLTVYLHLRTSCILQIELYIQTVLLPLSAGELVPPRESTATPFDLTEVAVESILDFCHLPGFLRAAYAYLDCRMEASNVFEDMCKELSRRALPSRTPGSRGVAPVNIIAMQGLMAVMAVLAEGDPKPASLVVPPKCLYRGKTYVDIWASIINGNDPECMAVLSQLNAEVGPDSDLELRAWESLCSVRLSQWEKSMKKKLSVAIGVLNKDHKQGIQFMQVNKLLPDPMDATSVAGLLRYGRGVDKQLIGNFLGKNDQFNQEVLAAYVRTFHLSELSFDIAFRALADTFKQPPETQQVMRFTKRFVQAFLDAHNNDYRGFRTMKCLDDFLTVSLWHNSTWYNSNEKVPKMTTLAMFINTMSDSISDFDAPDPEVFRDMYEGIIQRAFPQGTNEPFLIDMPTSRLHVLAVRSRLPRGQMPAQPSQYLSVLDRDMFLLMWGPAIRAVSAVLEHAPPEDETTISEALRCIRLAAHIAKDNHVDDVMDSLLTTLSKFAALDPSRPYPQAVIAFGLNRLAMEAMQSLFAVVSEYGDMLRAGWDHAITCIMRLHKMHLVDPSVFEDEKSEGEGESRLQCARVQSTETSSGNLFGFFFSGSQEGTVELTPAELDAQEAAKKCVAECRLDTLFEDSKFLGQEALQELVRAVMEAGGPLDGAPEAPVDLDIAEAALELLIKLSLRNRDRIQLILPPLHAHLSLIVENTTPATVSLTKRAVRGLLRVCTRLLTYRPDVAESLLDSLKIRGIQPPAQIAAALDMGPASSPCLHSMAPVVAKGVQNLVQACAKHIRSHTGWQLIVQLIRKSCVHPDAVAPCFLALEHVAHDGAFISTENYMQIVSAISDLVRLASAMLHPRHAAKCKFDSKLLCKALDLLESIAQWLLIWRQRLITEGLIPFATSSDMHNKKWYANLASFWHHLLEAICQACVDWNHEVRNHAMVVLHQSLLTAGESLNLTADTWGATWKDLVLPMVQQLSSTAVAADADEADDPALERTLCMAINIMSKAFLAHVSALMQLKEWRGLWLATLQALASCAQSPGTDLQDAVRGAMSSMLKAMCQRKLLIPHSRDDEATHLWDRSWGIAAKVSSQLTPALLGCEA